MKEGYTHITVILDRSGSMDEIRDDTVGGINAFLAGQKGEPGEATLTLVQFDTQDPYAVVWHFRPIEKVPAMTRESYVPRGGTPLLDALGRGINDIEASVARLDAAERPEKVVVAVITDGQENASREFRKQQIEEMILKKQASGWEFVFLSADLAAIGDAHRMGFRPDSTVAFDKSSAGVVYCMSELDSRTRAFRRKA